MPHELMTLIATYGMLVVFFNVLIEQAGLPLPAVPTLLVAGALAAGGKLPLFGIILAALLACLIADTAWYYAGRRLGARVMRTICRISLSPDSCVSQSELRFQRWRGRMLLVAKFVPGLSTVAPPLVGAMGLPVATFLLLDALGSLLWGGLAAATGYLFAAQIDRVLAAIEQAGTLAGQGLLLLLIAYIVAKGWQRRRLLATLRTARISVDELRAAIEGGQEIVVVDVRSPASRVLDPRMIPGAVLADLDGVAHALNAVPLERELVLYCNCPNEVSAAKVAALLTSRGYRRVRPLQGGLDAWDTAGHPLVQVPPDVPPSRLSAA